MAIANVLDGFALLFPEKMLRKVKLHLLVHLEEGIVAFGPLVAVSTERFESFKSVFRSTAVYSNRNRPSRDIALGCASQDGVKTFMSGGYIQDEGVWRLPSRHLYQCRR